MKDAARAEALRFLALLGKDPAASHFRFFPHKKSPRKKEIGARSLKGFDPASITSNQRQGRGAYVVIGNGGAKKEEITDLPALFVEWDDKPVEWQRTAWRELGLPEPSIQVETGGKSVHTYWVLTEPMPADQWLPLLERLINHCSADPQCDGVYRVMRLPGAFYIGPSGKPTTQTRITLDTGKTYQPDEILPAWAGVDEWADTPPADAPAAEPTPRPRREHPPQTLGEVREALACIPEFLPDAGMRRAAPGTGPDGDFLKLIWGLREAVREAGESDAMTLALIEEHSPKITDAADYLKTESNHITAKTFWKIARIHGYRGNRRQPTDDAFDGFAVIDDDDDHQGRGDQEQKQKQESPPERLTRQKAAERLRDAHRDGVADVELRLLISELTENTGLHPLEIDKLSEAARQELERELQQEREQERLLQERDRQELAAGITLSWLLPQRLADALATITQHLPYDDRAAAVAWLATMAGLTKLGTTVNGNPASGYTVPMNLFIAIVSDTGKMKSPLGKAAVVNPTEPIRLDLAREHSRAMERWQQDCQGVKPADRPPPPTAARIKVNNYTGESLTAALQELEARGFALLVYRDELAGLFGSLNAYRKGDDEEQLLELFDGGGFTSLRVKAGDRSFNRSHVSIYGTIQPAVLSKLVSGDDSNGKWARFLFCPLPNITRALPEAVSLEEEQVQRQAEATLQELAKAVFCLPPAEYRLTPDAMAWFSRYHLQKQQDNQAAELGTQKALHGKGAGKVLRVAGLLHVAERVCAEPPLAEPHAIGIETLKKAITLVDTLDLWASGFHAEAAAEAAGGMGCFMRKIHNLSAQNRRQWIGWRDVSRKLSGRQRTHLNREAFMSAVCRLAADKHGECRLAGRGGQEYRAASGPI